MHLLAAILEQPGVARELLTQRGLDSERILRRASKDGERIEDAIAAVLQSAQELARRAAPVSGSRAETAATAIHVLLALVGSRRYAAFAALAGLGVDVVSLRSAATRVAVGVTEPPRARREGVEAPCAQGAASTLRRAESPELRGERDGRTRPARAVEVAWIPPLAARGDAASTCTSQAGLRAERDEVAPDASCALALDPAEFPLLARLGQNLAVAAARGELEPAVGREEEIERALEVLGKRHANNPLYVGEPGVGKSTVMRGVAARLATEALPRVVVELKVSDLVTGTGARGQLVERIAELRAELSRAKRRVVLLIDDVHELFACAADEALGELKNALGAGELPMIAATTHEQHRKLVEAEPALARRFGVIEVEPPSEENAAAQLRAVCDRLGAHHAVRYDDDAIAAAISWSNRYLPGRALPDKAVAVLDLAGARVRRTGDADGNGRSGRRARLDVRRREVASVLATAASVPVERLLESDGERMLRLEELLAERVVGHRDACARVAAVLRRNAAGLRGKRPIGSLLLLGPTGVGKTEMAKAIAELLFHSSDAMTRLDMSEYAEAHAVARLVGAPPGYVGHEAGGQLTEAVRKRPYQVVLLDEIEKAHRDVLLAFLQVFDEGRLTDGRGRTVDFTNAVIVLTSNLGASEMRAVASERRVGFAAAPTSVDVGRLEDAALTAAKRALPPELYNRLDEVLFFAPLARDEVRAITMKLLERLVLTLAARNVTLEYDDAVLDALLDQGGYEPELGARPMRRAVARLLEAPLADLLLSGELADGGAALVGVDAGAIVIDTLPPRRSRAAR